MTDDDVLTRPAPGPDATIRYAPYDEGIVDLHLPVRTDRPVPLVVFVHGGFWREAFDRTHARPLAEALVAQGWAVALPEYRRVGGAGGWPDTALDVERATEAVLEMLPGLGVQVETATLSGHSAGGHLVLWLAGQPVAERFERIVALAPVADLRRATELGVGDGAAAALLGGTPEQVPDAYDAADPATRLVDPPGPDLVVVHGTEDDVVPIELSRRLAAPRDWLELREVDGADHSAMIDPLSSAWASHVLPALTPRGHSLPHPVGVSGPQ